MTDQEMDELLTRRYGDGSLDELLTRQHGDGSCWDYDEAREVYLTDEFYREHPELEYVF